MDTPSSQPLRTGGAALDLLIVEDNPGDYELIAESLEEIFALRVTPTWERTVAGAGARMAVDRFDCVMLDLGLPDSSGFDGLTQLLAKDSHTPVIVLTGQGSREVATQAIKLGAQDYMVKGELVPEILARSIAYAIERKKQQNDLEAANAELDRFAAAVAHDLKTPLTVISGFSEVLLDSSETLDDHTRNGLERIHDNALRANAMITEMLDYGRRLVTGEARTGVDLDAVADWVEQALADKIAVRSAKLDRCALPIVWANEAAMRQLLLCLFDNSIKYTDAATTPYVLIDAVYIDHAWRIEVIDNGVGIPEAERNNVFASGVRLTPELAPGSGIGLSGCAEIVRNHGGVISIDGSDFGGTRITFTIAERRDI